MPKEYAISKQPIDLIDARNTWMEEGVRQGRDRQKFYYEVRETKEFTIEDILEQLAVIYQLRPEDFADIKVKKENSEILENVALYLKPEISIRLFGNQVSFEFIVRGRLTDRAATSITNISRIDYDENLVPNWEESLADYIHSPEDGSGHWKTQPNISQTNQPAH